MVHGYNKLRSLYDFFWNNREKQKFSIFCPGSSGVMTTIDKIGYLIAAKTKKDDDTENKCENEIETGKVFSFFINTDYQLSR